jgi:DNA polymerase III subunit gamma/tau
MLLYERQRPTRLDSVVGQTLAVRLVRAGLSRKPVPASWIVSGEWGTGKTTLAGILAKSVGCLSPIKGGEGCGSCEHCLLARKGESPNIAELNAASFGGIDDLRAAIQEAATAPVGDCVRRSLLIDEAHMLSQQAQGLLLPYLESGCGGAVLILVTTSLRRILETVRSRPVPVRLFPVRPEETAKALAAALGAEGIPFEEKAVEDISVRASGHVRDALVEAESAVIAAGEVTEASLALVRGEASGAAESVLPLLVGGLEPLAQACGAACGSAFPSEVWTEVRSLVSQACAVAVTGMAGPDFSPVAIRFAGLANARLRPLAHWVVGELWGYRVETEADLVLAASAVRERLGPISDVRMEGGMYLGTPARLRDRTPPPGRAPEGLDPKHSKPLDPTRWKRVEKPTGDRGS